MNFHIKQGPSVVAHIRQENGEKIVKPLWGEGIPGNHLLTTPRYVINAIATPGPGETRTTNSLWTGSKTTYVKFPPK